MLSKKAVMALLAVSMVLALVAAQCGAPAMPEKIVETVVVKETVEVEKEVEKIVKETVEVEKIVEVEVTPVVEEKEPVELRIAWWGSQERHTRTIGVIKLFEQQYPWIKIKYEMAGWGDYWTRLSTQAAGGNLPDIMQQDYSRIKEWADNGLIIPLDEFVDSGILDFSHVANAGLQGGRIDGKLYALNLGNNSQTFVIDVDAWEAAGMDMPSPDWTWTEFEELCLEYTQKTGVTCLGGGLGNDMLWKGLYLGYGEWGYADDGKSLGYTDDQPLIDYMSMILRLQDAGAVRTREDEIAEGDTGVETQWIVSGDAAMAYIWSNQIVAMWTAAGLDRNFVMYHVPRAADGCCSANYVKPSMFWSITSHSKHPEEAALFLNFFTNSVEANEILMAERGVPISSAVKEGLASLLTPAQLEMFEFLGRVEADNSPIRPPDPLGNSDVINNVYDPQFMEPVLLGQTTPEEGVAILREQANAILGAQE